MPLLQAALLEHRDKLLRFLKARGAGDDAEDLLQEVWLRIAAPARADDPVAAPLSYLFQVANSVMIDRYRSSRQAALRDQSWTESMGQDPASAADGPTPERIAIGRDMLVRVDRRLEQLGPRPARIFRRHRVDGAAQREIAQELGISLSTVESDLRAAYRAIAELREQSDEA
jgi:RNA polymerase sigma-70 factor (ECF subfamily)